MIKEHERKIVLKDDHLKLLYLISKYSSSASTLQEKDKWMKDIPLKTLVYEGIVRGVFGSYDYSPLSVDLPGGRRFLNISQEFQDNLSDIRSLHLVDRLKISSSSSELVKAYKITPKGSAIEISTSVKAEVDHLITCPNCGKLIEVDYELDEEKDHIHLICPDRNCPFHQDSEITKIEDISYEVEPYFPKVAHYIPHALNSSPLTIFSENLEDMDIILSAQEDLCPSLQNLDPSQIQTEGNIRDTIEKHLFIDDLQIIVSEFIPFGRNAMVSFNNKLDLYKRVKENLVTNFTELTPGHTSFELSAVTTRVSLVSFNESEYSNFITELVFPEEPYIVQKELIGVSLSQFGRVLLGVKVNRMENETKRFSFDYVTRLTSDITFDCSRLLNDLLSEHQRQLLNITYFQRTEFRQKYIILLGSGLSPDAKAIDYLDSGMKETEMKQILQYVEKTADLRSGGKLFIGTSGTVFISKDLPLYEPVLTQFAYARGIHVFIQNFFNRIFAISDEIKYVQKLTRELNSNPRAIGICQEKLAKITANCVLLSEISNYLDDSIDFAIDMLEEFNKIITPEQKELMDLLEVNLSLVSSKDRITDLLNLISGLENDVNNFKNQISVIEEKRLQQIFRSIKESGNIQRRMQKSTERQDDKMGILELILSGSLAFEILGLFVGEYSFSTSGLPSIFGKSVTNPVIWFIINLFLWMGMVFLILKSLGWMTRQAEDTLTITINYDKPINIARFEAWLNNIYTFDIDTEWTDQKVQRNISVEFILDRKFVRGTIEYDDKNGYLYMISLEVSHPGKKTKSYYSELLKQKFRDFGIFYRNTTNDKGEGIIRKG